MTAFDAPKYLPAESSTALDGALAAVRTHFGALVAAIVAISIPLAATAAVILGLHLLAETFASSVGRTQISVVLNPAIDRAGAETVGALIKARTDVLEAKLRGKDHAADDLERSVGLQPVDAQAQLPDVWLVTLKPESEQGRATATVAYFTSASSYFGSLKGVDSVRFNSAWIGAGQSALADWGQVRTTFHASAFAVFAVVGFCIAMLAARSMDSMRDGSQVTMRALAIVGAVIGLGSVALVSAVIFTVCIAFRFLGMEGITNRIIGAAGADLTIVVTLAAVAAAVSIIGTCAGARGR